MIPRSIRVALFVLACGVVLWLSLAPGDQVPGANIWDKAKHAAAYLVLALVGAAAFPLYVWRVVICLFVFGVGVEVLQASMNLGRQGDPRDALANSIGIAVGACLALALREVIKVKARVGGE